MSVSTRCEVTDLIADQCACPRHRGDDVGTIRPRRSGPQMASRYGGRCACCEERYDLGDQIGYSSEAMGWVIAEHLEGAT